MGLGDVEDEIREESKQSKSQVADADKKTD